MNECKVIAIASRKGGVEKLTTARNLGYYLAKQGYHILLVDTDSQGNLSTGFGEPKTAMTVRTLVEPMWAVMQDEPLPKRRASSSKAENCHIFLATRAWHHWSFKWWG